MAMPLNGQPPGLVCHPGLDPGSMFAQAWMPDQVRHDMGLNIGKGIGKGKGKESHLLLTVTPHWMRGPCLLQLKA